MQAWIYHSCNSPYFNLISSVESAWAGHSPNLPSGNSVQAKKVSMVFPGDEMSSTSVTSSSVQQK